MPRSLVDARSLPVELRPYLRELVQRTRTVCGPHLITVCAVGSIALQDYRHGRSDVDIMVVVDPSLPGHTLRELAVSLAHPALPCPAAGLELVVYGSDFTVHPSAEAGYLLNLNTGPLLPDRADFDAKHSPAFWFVIDRSIARQSGLLLHGRPIGQIVATSSRRDLFAAILASVREHTDGGGHLPDNQVLNGCRSVVFCRTGRWSAKRSAARSIALTESDFRPLVMTALRSFQRPRSSPLTLPAADVRAFLTWVRERVEETAEAIGI
ncbi:aminoglycoside adenylyltransferase domain-containing protein [Nocardia donostiensis]|uniref:Translation initiation factor 2 n=1 Tax=Nocardia donostiensis TaxID=1538463 RepID=A0A1V2TB36_9NOCA|nr:aminoglycoside adenylyltransferase domain-containing protein [Nocardia donostiensis]ONM46709.1 translation initiation factor 2 [Nocardia donostiensis]OQS12790.1 translation initiation factor 2 [Nocardia donostiensis]OQS19332.1 translation initiation factor 2 [Nocardia donostiensis]